MPKKTSPADVPEIPYQMQMMELATGHMRAQAVYVAAKLGVADLLKDGPKTVEEIGDATQAHPG